MKITIVQKDKDYNEVVFSRTFERDTEKEILDIIKEFNNAGKECKATYLTYDIED